MLYTGYFTNIEYILNYFQMGNLHEVAWLQKIKVPSELARQKRKGRVDFLYVLGTIRSPQLLAITKPHNYSPLASPHNVMKLTSCNTLKFIELERAHCYGTLLSRSFSVINPLFEAILSQNINFHSISYWLSTKIPQKGSKRRQNLELKNGSFAVFFDSSNKMS